MAMDNRLMRPKTTGAGPEQDPPVQLKTEDNIVLTAEDGAQLTTE